MRWSVIGPLEGRLTGQSYVTLKVVDILGSKKRLTYEINTNHEGSKPSKRIINTLFKYLYFLITLRVSGGYYISTKRGRISAIVDFMYIIVARAFTKKIIVHLHGNEIFQDANIRKGAFDNFTFINLKLVDCVLCLNSYQSSELKKLGIKNVKILPNFTDLQIESESSMSLTNDRDIIKITYLSNFQAQKGFIQYINLFESFPDIQFSLCGGFLSENSPERQIFNEQFTNSLPNVRYYGFVGKDQKQNILRNSHFIFFVSTYPTEAQPLALLEAMGLGCVPIVANRPYISDLVTKDNGVILSADPDAEEIKSAICNLTIEKYIELSGNCKTLASSFTTTAFEANLLEIFDEFE